MAASPPVAQPGKSPHPELPYVLPFGVFMLLLACKDFLVRLGPWDYPLRVLILTAVLLAVSRKVISLRIANPLLTLGVGAGVFLLWIAPDVLIHGYRHHWMFENFLTGSLQSSFPAELRSDNVVLAFRIIRAVLIVPIVEELFWRGWLMRWLISTPFDEVPLGAYKASAFWITALLFAAEHGPYWEVGLMAGIAYNWLLVRTRSLGDCIIAHAITNGILAAYVMQSGHWEYWM